MMGLAHGLCFPEPALGALAGVAPSLAGPRYPAGVSPWGSGPRPQFLVSSSTKLIMLCVHHLRVTPISL